MKFFFHTRKNTKSEWQNQGIELASLARLPAVEEYIQLSNDKNNDHWHRVDLICHVAFGDGYVAELYCTPVKAEGVQNDRGCWQCR